MITAIDLISTVAQKLSDAGIDCAKAESELIISHFLNTSRFDVYLHPLKLIPQDIINKINEVTTKRCQRYPLQYLLGFVHFADSVIRVTPDVLIPRPETELLVDIILKEIDKPDLHVLDLCTGSGAIAIALKKQMPTWQITAADISTNALHIAALNAADNDCEIDIIHSDLFSNIDQKFDIIVSNPPYISQNEYEYLEQELFFEPKTALVAPDNGFFFYKNILHFSPAFLNKDGRIYLEIGAEQAESINSLAIKYQYKNIKIIHDLNNFPRILYADI